MNRIRLILHRLFRRPAITGPYRIYVRRTPGGAMLDAEHYLDSVLVTLADNPDLLDLLLRMADDRGQARQHDGWEPEALLAEKLKDAIGYELPVYGRSVMRLAYRLRRCTPLPVSSPSRVYVPAQRVEGGATA